MKLRIRDLREDADYTQNRVAAYLHCDQSQYSKYERGERPLPLDYAVLVLAVLRLVTVQVGSEDVYKRQYWKYPATGGAIWICCCWRTSRR